MRIRTVLGCVTLLVGVWGCGDTTYGWAAFEGGAESSPEVVSASLVGLRSSTIYHAGSDLGCRAAGITVAFLEDGQLIQTDWDQRGRDPDDYLKCLVDERDKRGTYTVREGGVVLFEVAGEPARVWQVRVDNPPSSYWNSYNNKTTYTSNANVWINRFALHQQDQAGKRFTTHNLDRFPLELGSEELFSIDVMLQFDQPLDVDTPHVCSATVTVVVEAVEAGFPQLGMVSFGMPCRLTAVGVEDWIGVQHTNEVSSNTRGEYSPAQELASRFGDALLRRRTPFVTFRSGVPHVLLLKLSRF